MSRKLIRFFREFEIPNKEELRLALKSFSRVEFAVFALFFAVLLVSTLLLLSELNQSFMTKVPGQGGSLSEGVVEAPRFVNPVLALSNTDKDLVSLIYSGLMRKDENGEFQLDLAEKFETTEDGLSYTFTLKDDIMFHDRKPITAEDVVFTLEKVKDPLLKSPERVKWEGITIEAKNEREVIFTLKQPYASFLENATLPILPKHIWENVPISQFSFSQFNINAVGSGPYKIKKIKKKKSGVISYFELESFNRFVLGNPYIPKITIRFYPDEDKLLEDFRSGIIDQMSAITPNRIENIPLKNHQIKTKVLPRIFGLFFNQNNAPVFTDNKVRKAFGYAINKKRIVEEVLAGYGTVIESPIPKTIGKFESLSASSRDTDQPRNDTPINTDQDTEQGEEGTSEAKNERPQILSGKEKAQKLLLEAGFEKNEEGLLVKEGETLSFSISTGNIPELKRSAELIKEDLEALGAKVELKIFEIGDLQQNVIRPREFETLFFGQIINNETDLYAFWHSSQRNDPGLNIALYTNKTVDALLKEILTTIDADERAKKYARFEEEIRRDSPAIFIYSPKFIYITHEKIKGIDIGHITRPEERFSNVYKWFINEEKTWKIFSK